MRKRAVRESPLACAQQLGDTEQDELVVVLHVRFATGGVRQVVVVRDYYMVAVHHVHVLDCDEWELEYAILRAALGHAVRVFDVQQVHVSDLLHEPVCVGVL